jgi:hypothetical protein
MRGSLGVVALHLCRFGSAFDVAARNGAAIGAGENLKFG